MNPILSNKYINYVFIKNNGSSNQALGRFYPYLDVDYPPEKIIHHESCESLRKLS